MKDLEILENLDLTKILEELSNRDKKITRLDKVDTQFSSRITALEDQHL